MKTSDSVTLGQRVTQLRTVRGLSQRELAAAVGRSESWVSQVERDVLHVERIPVLHLLADALGVGVRELRPDAVPETSGAAEPSSLGRLRLVLTGHPCPTPVTGGDPPDDGTVGRLAREVRAAWAQVHAGDLAGAGDRLAVLVPQLERALRLSSGDGRRRLARELAGAYQACASAFARADEADAAWVAADRSVAAAEQGGDPLGVFAGAYRMTYAFVTLRRLEQAEHVARSAVAALSPLAGPGAPPETLSLLGALHLALSLVHARGRDRPQARGEIARAREVAERLGEDRNDYETEFGPTNVELHAIAIAVELGDAGEALDLAHGLDASNLSPERRGRLALDLARAHAQRRDVAEAVRELLEAERHGPEQLRMHAVARQLVRDLVAVSGRRVPASLAELAQRFAVS